MSLGRDAEESCAAQLHGTGSGDTPRERPRTALLAKGLAGVLVQRAGDETDLGVGRERSYSFIPLSCASYEYICFTFFKKMNQICFPNCFHRIVTCCTNTTLTEKKTEYRITCMA